MNKANFLSFHHSSFTTKKGEKALEIQNKLRDTLSKRTHELKGRKITYEESNELAKVFNSLIPEWFFRILLDFPLAGCYFELSENLDESELGASMKWMNPSQVIKDITQVYPAIVALPLGYVPVGFCMTGSGDDYFIQFKNANLPLVRIPHEAVDRNMQLIERRVEVVSTNLWKFFEIVEID
jgi:hypothetical protein